MAIPNPNPNIADGIKSDNKTYSSNKIESLIKTATELPIPEAGDAGKVLTVNSDSDGYELDYAGHDLIDDNTASSDTVYSSSKVDTLLSGKEDNLSKGTGSLDANNLHSVNGFYRCVSSNITNCPSSDGYLIVIYNGEGSSTVQMFIPSTSLAIYVRTTWAAGTVSWTAWKSVTLS